MPGSKFKGRVTRLRELLEELESAEAMRDADGEWHATESVLDLMYRLEQDAGGRDRNAFRALLQQSEDGGASRG